MTQLVMEVSKISLKAIAGTPSPSTMRLLVHIGEKNVVILIDYDGAHNFLDFFVAQKSRMLINKKLQL